MEPIIEVENLTVVYNLGKTNEFTALANNSLSIYKGEYIIIFGPSGCGKSTLLYSMAGLQKPTNGKIKVANRILSELSPKELVKFHQDVTGMIFQAYYLIPSLSVLDNVCLSLIFKNIKVKERSQRAKELLKQFGIEQCTYRLPLSLSGGQQQRVAIVRALMTDPPIIFADEPVGNLDSKSAEVTMELLDELNKKYNKTIILVTHDPSYLSKADRIFHMRDGRIERVAVNESGKKIAPMSKESPVSDILSSLAQRYPTSSEIELKSKALVNWLVTVLDEPRIARIEEIIKKRIKGEYTQDTLHENLNLSFEKGGAGLYAQRATEFTKKIEFVLMEAGNLHKTIKPTVSMTEDDLKAVEIRKTLLDRYHGELTLDQINRLDRFIRLRIENMINRAQFLKYLDLPFKAGGVGLNHRTAHNFTNLIEIILINI
ncbi:MAG: ABC transporter ATP-binding protein [Patescibacteria group bacterium]|jgi:putative ABC transport system ATP-binding protein|nr:ABC transporter ATP-binding protein [Patescibacteria group bacterium]